MFKLKKYSGNPTLAKPNNLPVEFALDETIDLYSESISRIPQSIFDRVNIIRAKALLNEGDKASDFEIKGSTREERLNNLKSQLKQQREKLMNSS